MGLIAELKRRNVFRVAIAYVVFAWVLAQVAGLAFESFGTPDWVPKSVLFLLVLGLPIAIFFAWAFEMTPEGIKKESDVDRSQSITNQTGRKLDFLIIGVLVVAIGFLMFDKFGPATEDETATEVATTSGRASIAVLPFANRSNRDEDQFFTDGIHDDLLTTIANIGSMKVISRTSVMEYKDTTKKLPEIAKELGVANILEGGIQRSGNQVRINVQLIDAATDEHLWAEIYDRELTAENLFAIQSEVSNAIAAALHTALSPDEARRINSVPTKNLEAYEAYMLGRERWRRRTAESITESVELFKTATMLDPEFALAWVGLCDAYLLLDNYAGADNKDVLPKAEAALERAMQIDDQLGEAYTSLGAIHVVRLEHDEAEAAFNKSIELTPNYSTAYHWYGLLLRDTQRYAEFEQTITKALELDPLYPVLHNLAAQVKLIHGDFDGAFAIYERLIDIDPDSVFAYRGLSNYHVSVTGRLNEALIWDQEVFRLDPDNPRYAANIAWDLLDLGDFVESQRWLDKTFELQSDFRYGHSVATRLALATHDQQRILEHLSQIPADESSAFSLNIETDVFVRDLSVTGGVEGMLAKYEAVLPGIVSDREYVARNVYDWASISVAALLLESGNREQALHLLDSAQAAVATMPMQGWFGYGYRLAAIYAVRGEKEAALAELTKLIDTGYVEGWWYIFDHSLAFESLRDDPRFQALRARVAANVAEQLAKVNKTESQSFVN